MWGMAVSSGLMMASYAAPAVACKAGETITVDNDVPSSGYSEEPAANWETWSTDACFKTFRYLSRYVGDKSRKGKAVWKPVIKEDGSRSFMTAKFPHESAA